MRLMMSKYPVQVDEALCDMIEIMYKTGDIDYSTYKKRLKEFGGSDRIQDEMTAQKFQLIRSKCNLSQAEMARALKVSTSSVVKWESGKRPIPGPVSILMNIIDRNGLAILHP